MHAITQGFITEFYADGVQTFVTPLACVQYGRPTTTIYLQANTVRIYNKKFQEELTGS
jgi:hypothetical protein